MLLRRNTLGILVLVALCVSTLVGEARARPVFSGNANADFRDASLQPGTPGVPRNKNSRFIEDREGAVDLDVANALGQVAPDVEMPSALAQRVAGWDVQRLWIQYDALDDSLNIGIACFGICGDADGDGDGSRTSAPLAALGGEDYPDLARGEGFAVLIDLDLDVDVDSVGGDSEAAPWDLVLGVPSGQPAGATMRPDSPVPVLECSRMQVGERLLNGEECFGLYEYQRVAGGAPGHHFLRRVRNAADDSEWPVTNHNPSPVAGSSDLEFTIRNFKDLRTQMLGGARAVNEAPFSIIVQAWAGSNADDGIGEEYLPSETTAVRVDFPCLDVDPCGICLGDGSTCVDCAGEPNGDAEYDLCGVCGGDSSSCTDCNGVKDGTSQYDACGVCDGDESVCRDCLGVVNGDAQYDECDVCDGDSSSCLDCQGQINGASTYDECGVCDGDGSTCCGALGKPCCVNYCGVPDDYWNFILLPVTLDNLIEKFEFTADIFAWLGENMPEFDEVKDMDLHVGRMAEFNRLFLDECLEPFCESSSVLYTQLVFDNSMM